jgi:carboxymethylenebutenolidase
VLILHGDQDPIVPVAAAYELEKFLTSKKAVYEMKIYEGQGHGFHGSAQTDAGERALSFFNRFLGGVSA